MTELRLCKDCKHNKSHVLGLEFSNCTRDEFKLICAVSGKATVQHEYSGTQRKFDWLCGKGARYFEAKPIKPSLWNRFCVWAGKVGIGPVWPS